MHFRFYLRGYYRLGMSGCESASGPVYLSGLIFAFFFFSSYCFYLLLLLFTLFDLFAFVSPKEYIQTKKIVLCGLLSGFYIRFPFFIISVLLSTRILAQICFSVCLSIYPPSPGFICLFYFASLLSH